MRRTLVVHIGTPKTGSTSIQHMLHRLAIPLQKLGIHIPSSGRSGNLTHGGLAFVYPGSPLYVRSHRAWAALRDELCHHPAPRFVISAETFSTGAADHVADRVSDLAETVGLDVEVVAYVRAMSGPFGIGRWFFELVGEFDAALAPRERQDVEFGWRARTCGGLLAPAGTAAAAGLPNSARTVLPAPVAGSGGPAAGQSGTVPRWSVAIEVNPGGGRATAEAVERLRAEAGVSVAILVDVDEATADTEWLRERLGEDVRLRWGPVADACHIHRAVPLHVRAPARDVGIGGLLERSEVELGDAVAGTATLADGTRLSVARAWALHRVRRTGSDMSEFGRVVTIGARRLQAGVYPVLMDFWQTVSVIGRCGRWIAGGIHADRRDNPLRRPLRELRDLADRVARRLRQRFV